MCIFDNLKALNKSSARMHRANRSTLTTRERMRCKRAMRKLGAPNKLIQKAMSSGVPIKRMQRSFNGKGIIFK